MPENGGQKTDWGRIAIWGIAFLMLTRVTNLFGGAPPVFPKPPTPVPDPDPSKPLTEKEKLDCKEATDLVYSVLKGPAATQPQIDYRHIVLQAYAQMKSDNGFICIYNDFNERYGGKEDLRQWIYDEVGIADAIENTIYNRIQKHLDESGLGWCAPCAGQLPQPGYQGTPQMKVVHNRLTA